MCYVLLNLTYGSYNYHLFNGTIKDKKMIYKDCVEKTGSYSSSCDKYKKYECFNTYVYSNTNIW